MRINITTSSPGVCSATWWESVVSQTHALANCPEKAKRNVYK